MRTRRSHRPLSTWLALCALVIGGAAFGQEVQRIAAVVNDDVISIYDVAARTQFVIAATGLPRTADSQRRLAPQVLRGLIDERLQLQEAARLGIAVTESEIEQGIVRLERENQMPPGGITLFMTRIGVSRDTLDSQLRAALAWAKVLNRRVRGAVDVGSEEVDEVMAQIRASQGLPEYLASEIFLSVDSPDQDEDVRLTAQRLVEQIGEGADFSSVARQFSQSASASAAGDLGWVLDNQLDDEAYARLRDLSPGEMIGPVRSLAGYYILLLRDRRVLSGPAADDAVVSLRQILLPLSANASPEEIESQKNLADIFRETVAGCADMEKLGLELGTPVAGAGAKIKVKELAPAIRAAVISGSVGLVSAPQVLSVGVAVIMVCEREEAEAQLPRREEILANLTRQRIDIQARRFLRDLRRSAYIDLRA